MLSVMLMLTPTLALMRTLMAALTLTLPLALIVALARNIVLFTCPNPTSTLTLCPTLTLTGGATDAAELHRVAGILATREIKLAEFDKMKAELQSAVSEGEQTVFELRQASS